MEVADIDKTGEIEKNTYTIRFCAPERITLEDEKKIIWTTMVHTFVGHFSGRQ